ncbi:MAG: lipopolysaccharide kinase InaA family protein [Pyrinomonadaceae bacterium]
MKTHKDPLRELAARRNRARRLEERWRLLCDRHLPYAPEDSIWRYSREGDPAGPVQGWKLHVSATLLSACDVLERIWPLLAGRSTPYKAPRSLTELYKLNSGLFYGYSQIGKVFTVYPRTDAEAVELATRLDELTRRIPAPAVPFDQSFGGSVYYRFGAFARMEMEHADGRRTPAIRDRKGGLVPDVRAAADAKPDWVTDPFLGSRPPAEGSKPRKQHAQSFCIFRALVQRGKGGVYQAAHFGVDGPQLCLLKEGRRYGEVGWDGRDGAQRTRYEERVISSLSSCGVEVPHIISSFEMDGNFYLVTEFIEGESLHKMLARRERRMPVPVALRYGVQLCHIFQRLHAAGWVWRDCKPANILVTTEGRLRPIDFEGACPADDPDPLFWGTPGFTPPEWQEPNLRTCVSGDLYALGGMLYLLLTGRLPETTDPAPVARLRRGVPPEVGALVVRLLDRDPDSRPRAEDVSRVLRTALSASSRRARPAVERLAGARAPGQP